MLLQLRAREYQVMLISPDPISFELAYLPKRPEVALAGRIARLERIMVLQKLKRAGVQVWEWMWRNPSIKSAPGMLGRPMAWFRAIGR